MICVGIRGYVISLQESAIVMLRVYFMKLLVDYVKCKAEGLELMRLRNRVYNPSLSTISITLYRTINKTIYS